MRTALVLGALVLAGCFTPEAPAPEPEPLGDATFAPQVNRTATNETAPGNATEPTATEPHVIASGRIVATGPWTRVRSLTVLVGPGVDGFFFDAPAAGSRITTSTTGSGPYDLDFWFRDSENTFIDDASCATAAADEDCTVPEGAVRGEVTGVFGANLDVDVLLVAPPGPT